MTKNSNNMALSHRLLHTLRRRATQPALRVRNSGPDGAGTDAESDSDSDAGAATADADRAVDAPVTAAAATPVPQQRLSRSQSAAALLQSLPLSIPLSLSFLPLPTSIAPSPTPTPPSLHASSASPSRASDAASGSSSPRAAESTAIKSVPLIHVKSEPTSSSNSNRYVPLGVTPEAAALLTSLPAPLSVVVFAGFGRSGKSKTASSIARILADWHKDKSGLSAPASDAFASRPGNTPCTHGIDMAVVRHPDASKGHILLLDCEGAANHNQTAIPFVMGLAARLASRIFVFERACFTTAGLESVMQIVNMGLATLSSIQDDSTDIPQAANEMTRSLTLVENMSINSGMPSSDLLADLLSCAEGDEMSNNVKRLISKRFDVSFEKLPFVVGADKQQQQAFDDACQSIAGDLVDSLRIFTIGGINGVPADGKAIVRLCNELVTQVRDGGTRFNMISATESLVTNMATEAANTVWAEFVARARAARNAPDQLTDARSAKHLRTVLRELEGFAHMAEVDLEAYTCRLQPREPVAIARLLWQRNYDAFVADVKRAHSGKVVDEERRGEWAVQMNRFVVDMVEQGVEALRQAIRLARFASILAMLSNYYFWKHGIHVVRNFAGGVISEMVD
ncbi:hypothetical protein HDU83_008649 [Entophlyctis luteolus]|nr:hypothetical protein HDU83_008649 [Entophlyctis luteolus]